MWSWSSKYLNKCIKWHFYSSRTNCAKLFWNPCINIEVMARTSSIHNHFIIWPPVVTWTFNVSEQMFQIALLLLKEITSAKLLWNPCMNVQVMAQTNPDGRMHAQRTHNAHTPNWSSNNNVSLTTSRLHNKSQSLSLLFRSVNGLINCQGPATILISFLLWIEIGKLLHLQHLFWSLF